MKMEDYKAYMERVETTAEMDERVLKNLKNSVVNEGKSNRNFWQNTMSRKGAFFYRLSVAAVCFLLILVIGKFHVRMNQTAETNAKKDTSNESISTETDSRYLRAPHFSKLYGEEIGSYATQCNYIDEDEHIRFCIQEMISDKCITEIIGYYEAKDDLGKTWLQERTYDSSDSHFTFSLKPDMSNWPETMVKPNHTVQMELNEYYNFHSGDYMTKQLKTYNTHKRTYFDYYCIVYPDFETKNVTVGYKLFARYEQISLAIKKTMNSEIYPLKNVKKSTGKHYMPSEVILSPLGGLMIKGQDLGIESASDKTADNFTTLRLNLQYDSKHNKKISIIENEVFRTPESCDGGIWNATILTEKQKKALGSEYNLFACRLAQNIDLTKIASIQIDDTSYSLKNSSDTDTTDN